MARDRYTAIDCTPVHGGALMARTSAEKPGIVSYSEKRDFRRDLDEEIRAEGFDYLWPNELKSIGNQPFPYGQIAGEPITLIHHATRPNGQMALIAATPTRIWRYFTLDDGRYVLGDANGVFVLGDANGPYFDENPGDWILIGENFVPNGPEFIQVHSGLVTVTQAIGSNILVANAAFFSASDVGKQVRLDSGQIYQILSFTDSTHVVVNGTQPTAIGPTHFRVLSGSHRWEAITVNGWTVFNNGADLPWVYRLEWSFGRPLYELREVGVARVGTVGLYGGILKLMDVSEIVSDKLSDNFELLDSGPTTATQIGSTYSALVTASQAAASTAVISSAAFFSAGMVSKYIRYTNGFKYKITAFTDNQHVTVDTPAPIAVSGLPFWIIDQDPLSGTYSNIVTSSAGFFTADMVGLTIVWDNGASRTITKFVNGTTVHVDSDGTIATGEFGIERRFSYGPYVFPYVNRFQYRVMWSLPGDPTRYGPVFLGSMGAGTYQLTLQAPQKSLHVGDEILVVGAGAAGGNLTAKIVFISSIGKVLWLDTIAETAVTDAPISRSDAVGSMLGYEDLQDDGSAILRGIQLKTVFIILKDTSFFIARFTGNVDAPFEFSEPVPAVEHKGIHYRWTLAVVDAEWLVYAGRSGFYRWDLTNQIPLDIKEFDLCANIFFDQATIDNTDSIFVANNAITRQLFFVFPSTTEDRALVYEYKFKTCSTTSMAITAAATVKRPQSGLAVGTTEDWFVMGTAQGVVLLYGKVDKALGQWNNSKEIYYRRGSSPYSGVRSDYSSILQSGLSHFGDQFTEKDTKDFILYLASQMAGSTALAPNVTFELFGTRNLAETKTLLLTYVVPQPETNNLIPFYFRAHYFQSRITVGGLDRNCRISGWAWSVSGVRSGSNIRRI